MKKQLKDVKKHFSDVSNNYRGWYKEEIDPLGAYMFNVRKKKTLSLITKTKGKVLDVGCGPGILIDEIIKDKKCEYFGIDISEKMIKEAVKKYKIQKKAHFSVGNAEKLDFPDKCFDVVIALGLLEYLDNPKDAFKEVNRILKDDGELIVSFCNRRSIYNKSYKFLGTPIKYAYHKIKKTPYIYHKMYTETDAGKLVKDLDLAVEKVVYYDANLSIFPINYLFKKQTVRFSSPFENKKCGMIHTGFLMKYKKEIR
ncbi:MAG: methyltransferase domain-containing protein [Nanohaloarchaea archaeon]|nr:methyltransferase domain-containing protein [Candidatus Nanohaloarchaea archaeon]